MRDGPSPAGVVSALHQPAMAHTAKNAIAGVGEAAGRSRVAVAKKGRWRKTAGHNVAKGKRPRTPARAG
jgi:hypothetical protein